MEELTHSCVVCIPLKRRLRPSHEKYVLVNYHFKLFSTRTEFSRKGRGLFFSEICVRSSIKVPYVISRPSVSCHMHFFLLTIAFSSEWHRLNNSRDEYTFALQIFLKMHFSVRPVFYGEHVLDRSDIHGHVFLGPFEKWLVQFTLAYNGQVTFYKVPGKNGRVYMTTRVSPPPLITKKKSLIAGKWWVRLL